MPILQLDASPSKEIYEKNRKAIVARLEKGAKEGNHGDRCLLGLELERFVYDPLAKRTISYEGIADTPGVEDLLECMKQFWQPEQYSIVDGHLAGFSASYEVNGQTVGASITIEPAAQLEISVGPATSVELLYGAVEQFDRQFELAVREMGVSWQLLAQGSNPTVSTPDDLPLIPKERYRLMDAYLTQTGRYARDMMRGSCATQVSVDYNSEEDMVACMRLAIAMGPLLSFGCDDTLRWRGSRPGETPRTARSRVWREMDPARCGTPVGTFEEGFGYGAYVDWIESIKPILFTADDGVTYDTANYTIRDIMERRDLAESEITHLFTMAFPNARCKGYIEIREADSLPPRMAAGFTALIKGLWNERVFDRACKLFEGVSASDVDEARLALEEQGWDAVCYGRGAGELLDQLASLAAEGLEGDEDARFLGELCDLWAARMVPRDLAASAPAHMA